MNIFIYNPSTHTALAESADILYQSGKVLLVKTDTGDYYFLMRDGDDYTYCSYSAGTLNFFVSTNNSIWDEPVPLPSNLVILELKGKTHDVRYILLARAERFRVIETEESGKVLMEWNAQQRKWVGSKMVGQVLHRYSAENLK